MACTKQPGYVGMYIDGEKVWEHYDDRVGSLPFYIILSLQVGGWMVMKRISVMILRLTC